MMSPYAGLDSPISIQAWGHQLKVDSADDKRIKQFADFLTLNNEFTPEPGASCENPGFITNPVLAGADGPVDERRRRPVGGHDDARPLNRTDPRPTVTDTPAPPARSPLRTVLLAVIAVGLVLLGGGLAVVLGIGRDDAPQPGAVDVGFSRDMARHHLQGVEMANLAQDHSTDPAVRGLAFDIATTQTNQVGRMQGWLALWGYSPTGGDVMAWMGEDMAGMDHDHAAGGSTLMPGMATEEELANLRSLQGTAFDVEFLRLMMRHHQGGLEMAQYAAEHGETDVVRTLARSIAESQTAETRLMSGMLEERGGTPLPAP